MVDPGAGAVSGSKPAFPSRVRPNYRHKLERIQGLLANAIWRVGQDWNVPETLEAAHSDVSTWIHEIGIHELYQPAGAEKSRLETLNVKMRLLDNGDVPLGERVLPDLLELELGSDEITGEAKLVLTLVAGEARTAYESALADPYAFARSLPFGPATKLVLKLGK